MAIDFSLENYLKQKRLNEIFQPPQGVTPPSVESYKRQVEAEPMVKDYQPSKKRKLGAILAGVGMGLISRNPVVGVRAARGVEYAPYNKEHREWQQEAEKRGAIAGIESAEQKRASELGVAQSRIGYYGSRGRAEESRAEAEQSRRDLERKQALSLPGSYEEKVTGEERIRKAGVRPPAPPQPKVFFRPQGGEVITVPPEGAPTSQQVVPPLPHNDPLKLENERHQHALARIKLRSQLVNKVEKPMSTFDAEKRANRYIFEHYPEHQGSFDPKTLIINKPTPELLTLRDQLVKKFIEASKSPKYTAIPPGSSGRYEVKEEEEDDDDGEEEENNGN